MTLPEGVQASGPTEPEATVTEEVVATEPVATEPDVTVEEETPEEAASDAALRAWAKDNGIEGVPASGKLSATWRETITAAMTAALDPKEEASAEVSSPESPETVATEETVTADDSTDQENPDSTEEESPAPEKKPVQPEFDHGGTEYRSVFKAPNTFVNSQAFTA